MTIRLPSAEELARLSRMERAGFRLGDVVSRRLPWGARAWNTVMLGSMLWVSGGRRFRPSGLEHLAALGPRDRVLLLANHRTYFDFFVVAAMIFWRTRLSHRVLFPVRSTFFYESATGVALNAIASGMAMFPPVMRERKKLLFNRYTLTRCVDELARPGTVLGLHPEGTRNKSGDPYALLPGQPGVGRVIVETDAKVFPIFVTGMDNTLGEEIAFNWRDPEAHPIDVCFGPELDVSDLRTEPSRPRTHKLAVDRAMAAIEVLARAHQEKNRAGGVQPEKARSSSSATAIPR